MSRLRIKGLVNGTERVIRLTSDTAHFAVTLGGRVFHVVMQKRVLRFVGGAIVMIGAGMMLEHHPDFVPKMVWETGAYLLHGIGSIPYLKPLEPLWGVAEEAESVVSDVASAAAEAV